MMDPVHIRCHEQQPEEPINFLRQSYIAVVDLDDKNKDYLIEYKLSRRHTDQDKNWKADKGGKHYFDRMETVC